MSCHQITSRPDMNKRLHFLTQNKSKNGKKTKGGTLARKDFSVLCQSRGHAGRKKISPQTSDFPNNSQEYFPFVVSEKVLPYPCFDLVLPHSLLAHHLILCAINMHSLCKYNPNGEGLISDKKEFQLGEKNNRKINQHFEIPNPIS